MKELEFCFKRIYKIGNLLGFDNILEKANIKEVIMGYVLGDTVFTKSTGEVKGADAINDETSEVVRKSQSERSYRLFAELGTEPSVFYLKKVDPAAKAH